jgi:excinuclease ABC subunit B
MSEDLTAYFKQLGLKVAYLHSEIKALERIAILRDLRLGKYDCLIGINLLREGLDLPEVSLVAILDADKQGFLRSERSLIQTIGRAARNVNGRVIMYADNISDAMNYAIKETNRRRAMQLNFNLENNVEPVTIKKDIRENISIREEIVEEEKDYQKLTRKDRDKIVKDLENEMKQAAKNLDFERAAELRDLIFELKADE